MFAKRDALEKSLALEKELDKAIKSVDGWLALRQEKELEETTGNKYEPPDRAISEIEEHYLAGYHQAIEELEENRIAHCDSLTKEEYNLERDFVINHMEKHHRIPTILDAIKYGMKQIKQNNCKNNTNK